MTDKTKVVGTRLQLVAVVGETDRYDIVSYSAAFEINSIPSGSIMLPVGYALDSGVPSEIMTRFGKFTAKQKIQIYLKLAAGADYGAGLEAFAGGAEQLIFDGYITGAILKRTDKSLHIVAHFVHWLSDLNNSSIFSGTSHVSNPPAMYERGAQEVYAGKGLGGGTVDLGDACKYESTEGHWSITSTSVNLLQGSSDVWDDAMKPFLACLVSQDSLDPQIQRWFNAQIPKQKRIEALNKLKSAGLVLDPGFTDPIISQKMSAGIRDGIRSTDANSTIWGLLLGYWGPGYFFAICPRVTDAYVAPLVGSYRDPRDNYKTIEANDYYSIDLNLSSRQSIGAVGMREPSTMTLGIAGLSDDLSAWPGVYPDIPDGTSDAAKYNGVFLAREMPFWLSQITFEPPSVTPATLPVTAFTSTLLDGGISAGVALAAAARRSQLRTIQRNLAQQFAQFFYVNEIFNNRSGDLSGKLRFDICPGTTVKVQAVALNQDITTGFDRFYGQVIRVSYTIDATQGIASTVFTLSNLRTDAEVADKVFSIEKPPLYAAPWTGDTLLVME